MHFSTALIAALGASLVSGATLNEVESLDKRVGLNCKTDLHPYCCGSTIGVHALDVAIGIGCVKEAYSFSGKKHKLCPKSSAKTIVAIVAIGEHTQTDLKLGDKVGIKWIADACMRCSFCRQGFESLCQNVELSGFTVDGSFQQYAVSYTNHLTKIPDSLPLDDAAPILCAGVTVYKAIKQSGVRTGEYIAIPGAGGGLGHLAVQYAAAMGLRVISVDAGDAKNKLVTSLGSETFVDFKTSKDLVADIKAATPDGLGPQAAIIVSAGAAAYEQALQYIRPGGTVVMVGLPPAASVTSDVFFHVVQEKKLIGSYVGNRQDAIEALDLAANKNGKVKCTYVTKPLEDLPDIYHEMHAGRMVGRTVVKLF